MEKRKMGVEKAVFWQLRYFFSVKDINQKSLNKSYPFSDQIIMQSIF